MSSHASISADIPIENPTGLRRLWLVLKHATRVALLPWPRYTFHDLATIQDAVDGPRFKQMTTRMSESDEGLSILREKPELSIESIDWRYLSSLPTDSFGYNVWHHFHSHHLLEPVHLGQSIFHWGESTEYAKDRFRKTHDFRHVLLGVGIRGQDEVLVNVVQASQDPLILSFMISLIGGIKHSVPRPLLLLNGMWRAWRTGREAEYLPSVFFEEYWEWSLSELRTRLNIEPVGSAYPPPSRHPDAIPCRDVA